MFEFLQSYGTAVISVIQTLLIFFAAIIAYVNLRKFRDARGVDFVIDAESTIDPLRHSLTGADPKLIRSIYRSYDLDDLSDEDCRAFPFMQSVYSHVSRIYYILDNGKLDLGLQKEDRDELINSWTEYLVTFRDHPAMQKIHASAMARRDFNQSFLTAAERLMRKE